MSRRLSPSAYRRVTLLAVVALAFIVVTGGAVRVTGSGLGCPDWPTCDESRIVAPLEYHAMVEFVNRTITGLVSVAVMLAVLGALRREPRRRDLTWLSLGLVAGVLAQIVLGGLTVLFHLAPPFVMGHFLVSMVLLWNAVVLHHRAGVDDDAVTADRRPRPAMSHLLVASAALTIFLGTVVTASGPHGGDPEVERLPFTVSSVARLHAGAVWLFLAMALVTLLGLVQSGAPAEVLRRGRTLLAVIVAQGALGYIQYFTQLPAVLVGLHIAGATAVWIAVLRLHLASVGISLSWSPPPKRLSRSTNRASTTSSSRTVPGSSSSGTTPST